jgi:hypothetical protein
MPVLFRAHATVFWFSCQPGPSCPLSMRTLCRQSLKAPASCPRRGVKASLAACNAKASGLVLEQRHDFGGK